MVSPPRNTRVLRCWAMDDARTGADGREAHRIATKVFDTLLLDQITRGDSLNASAGVLAGLGGVVTTLAGVVPHLTTKNLGRLGVAGAGLSVVLAVVALILRRPGREPRQPQELLAEILASDDAQLTEDVLLRADVAAAERNDARLRHKAQWVVGAASTLAASVLLLVTGMI